MWAGHDPLGSVSVSLEVAELDLSLAANVFELVSFVFVTPALFSKTARENFEEGLLSLARKYTRGRLGNSNRLIDLICGVEIAVLFFSVVPLVALRVSAWTGRALADVTAQFERLFDELFDKVFGEPFGGSPFKVMRGVIEYTDAAFRALDFILVAINIAGLVALLGIVASHIASRYMQPEKVEERFLVVGFALFVYSKAFSMATSLRG